MRCIKTLLIVLVLAAGTTACTGKDGTFDLRKPYSLDLTPPEGPVEYEKGWTDGCESGMSAYSPVFYKFVRVFDLQMDTKLRNNKMYYQAWRDAYLYCAMYWNSVQGQKF